MRRIVDISFEDGTTATIVIDESSYPEVFIRGLSFITSINYQKVNPEIAIPAPMPRG